MAANDLNSDAFRLCDSIRQTTDFCETLSFEHNVNVETPKSRSIGDIATFLNVSLSTLDQLAKPG